MAFAPIAFVIPEYDRNLYKNWWLKAYEPGTTTPQTMATDSTGGTTAAKFQLNTEGFPITAGSALVVPHIDGDYDLWLFPTAAEADANDTTNALQFADNLGIVSLIQGVSNTSSEVVLSADTVADLKTKDLQSGQTISTKGYYTAGDGGGASYLIQTAGEFGGTPDEFGDHTLNNGNVAVLQIDGAINIKQFGAIGDGATDDTASLQAAENKSSLGKSVFVPKGEYLTTSLVIESPNVHWFGESGGNQGNQTNGQLFSSAIRFTNTSGNSLSVNNPSFTINRVVFEHLTIKGETTDNLVNFKAVSQVTFDNVIINNEANGGGGLYCDLVFEFSMSNSFVFQGGNTRTGRGVVFDNTDGGLFGQINFYNTTFRDWDEGLGFNGLFTDNKFFQTLNLFGCQTKGCNIGANVIGKVQSGSFVGCYHEGNKVADIQFVQGAQNFNVFGNFFNSPDATGANIRIGRNAISNDNLVRNIGVKHCQFTQINAIGIYNLADESFAGGSSIGIEFNYFEEKTAAGAAAIVLTSTDRTASIENNSFGTITTQISNATNAVKLFNSGDYQGTFEVRSLTGAVDLDVNAPEVITYNANGADRTIRLPLASTAIGKQFIITCDAASGGSSLLVKDSTSVTTLAVLTSGNSGLFWNDGTTDFGKIL